MKIAVAVAAVIVTASPVPTSVQRAIPKKVPAQLRYVPTEAPSGYRYAKWHGSRYGLDIYFARAGGLPTLGFHVLRQDPPGRVLRGDLHLPIRLDTGLLRTTHNDQQYWRCVRGGRVSIEATAFRSDGSTSARRRAIAAMVASARQLS